MTVRSIRSTWWKTSFGPLTRWLLVGSLLIAPRLGAAHQIWIEVNAKATKVYFGEFADNQHEVSPGYLDKLASPTAMLVSAQGSQPVELTRAVDGLVLASRPNKGQSIVVVDSVYPMIEGKDGEKATRTAWTPAARYVADLGARSPELTLDIVPTGQPGEFQVHFRGAPLAKAETTLVAQSGWSRKGWTSENGKVTFSLPWKGTYALLVRHRDTTPGTRAGATGNESYDIASFATTLTFTTRSGLPSPPFPPVAPPN